MDKNTIIGFILIAAIVIGFAALNKPSEAEIAKRKKYNDSIALVQQQQAVIQQQADATKLNSANPDSTALNDSAAVALKSDAFGAFKTAAFGEEKFAVSVLEELTSKVAVETILSALLVFIDFGLN